MSGGPEGLGPAGPKLCQLHWARRPTQFWFEFSKMPSLGLSQFQPRTVRDRQLLVSASPASPAPLNEWNPPKGRGCSLQKPRRDHGLGRVAEVRPVLPLMPQTPAGMGRGGRDRCPPDPSRTRCPPCAASGASNPTEVLAVAGFGSNIVGPGFVVGARPGRFGLPLPRGRCKCPKASPDVGGQLNRPTP